jgi:hypothetical protein
VKLGELWDLPCARAMRRCWTPLTSIARTASAGGVYLKGRKGHCRRLGRRFSGLDANAKSSADLGDAAVVRLGRQDLASLGPAPSRAGSPASCSLSRADLVWRMSTRSSPNGEITSWFQQDAARASLHPGCGGLAAPPRGEPVYGRRRRPNCSREASRTAEPHSASGANAATVPDRGSESAGSAQQEILVRGEDEEAHALGTHSGTSSTRERKHPYPAIGFTTCRTNPPHRGYHRPDRPGFHSRAKP